MGHDVHPELGPDEVLARPRRRARPVRRVPARLQAARRSARPLLRARPRGRRGRAHDVRPLERLLRRPDREEAAEPLPPRVVGPLVRHGGLQPRVPVLSELGHLEVEGDRHARRRRRRRRRSRAPPRSSAAAASRSRTTTPSSSSSTRSTSRTRARARGIHAVAVTAGYVCPEPRARVLRAHRRGQRRPQGFTEDFYHHVCGGQLGRSARHARVPRARDRRVGRDHEPAHPGPQRLRRRARRHDRLGRRAPRSRRPDALHRVPSRLQMLDTPPTPPATLSRARRSRRATACATRTPATSTTPRAGARTARRAARWSSSATGTCSGRTDSPTTAGAGRAARRPRTLRRSARHVGRASRARCGSQRYAGAPSP